MPPPTIRHTWTHINHLLLFGTLLFGFQWQKYILASSSHQHQELSSMTADGWRPILGTRRDPPALPDEITHYRNPQSYPNNDAIRAEPVAPASTAASSTSSTSTTIGTTTTSGASNNIKLAQFFPGLHGIPISMVTRNHLAHNNVHKKLPTKYPPILHFQTNGKRHIKPIRLQASAHSNPQEYYLSPSTGGSYAYFNQGPTKNHFTLGHLDFSNSNRFLNPLPPSNDNFFNFNTNPSSPIHGFIFPKHHFSNDINFQFHKQPNTDFTRNLIPPPLNNKDKYKISSTPKVEPFLIIPPSKLPPTVTYKFKEPSVDVQVTKENLKSFHNLPGFDFPRSPSSTSSPLTYEVTENKPIWRLPFQREPPKIEINLPFLPTPYRPELSPTPTLATHTPVSTIYAHVSQQEQPSNSPTIFDIKEVSTHFPILANPSIAPVPDITNELSTAEPPPPPPPQSSSSPSNTAIRPHRRRRPGSKLKAEDGYRKRPKTSTTTTTTSTTTEQPIVEYFQEEIQTTTQKPRKIRPRIRTKPLYPIAVQTDTTDIPHYRDDTTIPYQNSGEYSFEYGPEHSNEDAHQIRHYEYYSTTTQPTRHKTPEDNSAEQDEELSTIPPLSFHIFDKIEEKQPHGSSSSSTSTTTTSTSTTSTTSTTTTPEPPRVLTSTSTSSSRPTRIRRPVVKYDTANRPRFSVKDYRQRISSSTSSTTTETPARVKSPQPPRNRHRFSTASTTSTTTTTTTTPTPLTTTEEVESTQRIKFIPSHPRHPENEDVLVDRVRSRLRPTNRFRSTSSTTTPSSRVSIKPNLFSQRRRPPPGLTLRQRIANSRNNRTQDETTTRSPNDAGVLFAAAAITDEPDLEDFLTTVQSSGGSNSHDHDIYGAKNKVDTVAVETTTTDILKNESFMYSQRVSDLTSSAKNEYDTPGMFKSLPSNSRKIPNFFTLATEDPILPIEAFFHNIKDGNSAAGGA